MIKQLALGATLGALAFGAQAEFEDTEYDWYIDPMAFYSITDDERGANIEDGAGARIIFGRRLNQHWALEAGFVGDSISNTAGPDTTRTGLTLDARYDFSDGGLTPFVLVGAGVLSNRTDGQKSESNALVNVGLGFLWQFHRNGAAIRSEVRAKQTEENNKDFLDYDLGVGIHIPLDPENNIAPVAPATPAPVVRDTDRDGVHDGADRCPGTPPATRVDTEGCPIADIITLRGMNFARNSAELTLAGADLERALQVLRQYPDMRVLVAGHTDSRSTETYNQQLSEKRAEGVKYWLIQRGIGADRMETTGFGESRPIADNSTAEGRAQNRRVELHVLR